MTKDEFLYILKSGKSISFEDFMQLIDTHYHFQAINFKNGHLSNGKHENQGSAKVFGFAKIHHLSALETLHIFGEHYLNVLCNPNEDSHQNIRQFMQNGWAGVVLDVQPLREK